MLARSGSVLPVCAVHAAPRQFDERSIVPRANPGCVLVLSLAPFRYATRTRKASRSYADAGYAVRFLGMQSAGRTSTRVEAGSSQVGDSIVAHHVKVRRPAMGLSRATQVKNLTLSYLPALVRIMSVARSTPASVVHVTGVHLIPVALAHKACFGSSLVLDINERPASVKAKGSLFGSLSWIEPALIRVAGPRAEVVTVVTPGHVRQLSADLGVEGAVVVRNAPLSDWRHGWVAPPASPPLKVVTVGALFLGRAFEMLIRATGHVHRESGNISLTIVGTGRPEYLASLRQLIQDESLSDVVDLRDGIESHEVSEVYTRGHVGLALYEGADPGNDSLSNKIIETVASGRPVLAGNLPENRAFVTEHGVGWLTEVSEEGIASALRSIAQTSSEELNSMAEKCYRTATAALTWEAEFSKVLDRLRSRQGAGTTGEASGV